LERSWHRWIEQESSRRLAFFAFLMDAQHASIFGHTPVLSANDIMLPLPCAEKLWDCTVPEQWERGIRTTPEPPHFLPTLKALLGKTPVPSTCSAYARLILLHGLFSVTTHLQAKDASTLGVGAGKHTLNEDWRDILDRAINTWSFSLFSQTPSLCLDAARSLHRMAHITIHTNVVDFNIVAGAPSLLGSLLSKNDKARANNRVRAWSERPESRKAVYHSLLLVQETVFTSRTYRAWEDNIQLRPWCLYHATLVLWAYGYMREGVADETSGVMGAEEYLVRMLTSLTGGDESPIVGANRTTGLIQTVRNCLEGCRWELLEEAYVTLGRLIGISPN